ncbi:MAG: hypothetical protein ACJARD_001494 [Alphaproteobacteria bacterium]|jgi:hypothetical protein
MQHITRVHYRKAQENRGNAIAGERVTNILLDRVHNRETPEAIAAYQGQMASKQSQTANEQENIAFIQHSISNAQDTLSKEFGERAWINSQEIQKIERLNNKNTKTLGAIRKNLANTEKQYKEFTELKKNAASTRSAYFEGMLVGSVLTMAAAAAAYFLLNPKSAR